MQGNHTAVLIGMFCTTALCGCAVDTIVYELRNDRSESPTDAGQRDPTDNTASDAPRVLGCDAANAGGVGAIFESIVSNTQDASDWLRPGRSCEADRDCQSALLTPACNSESALCQPCPDIEARVRYNMRLARCLVEAIGRCCSDPSAPQDCVFRDCVSACGPQ